ncbi:MAG: anthranilate phosphoribosyltransferase, partial [Actinomycetota bacterium]|nr:anthranilate phosphoribosyltransferase [Actinomycetota bacterium]
AAGLVAADQVQDISAGLGVARDAIDSGAASDVLEALGVRIDLPPDGVARCIDEVGIGFCFAPAFHPALRHAGPPRRELGIATIFNFLGPLTNPAGATHQALGVADPNKIEMMVATLARLGSTHVLAFHGSDGLDELTLAGGSTVIEFRGGEITHWTLDPSELDLERASATEIAGGSAADNAATIRGVLAGEEGAARDVVALNAAAGLVAADQVQDISAGLGVARDAIDSGAASDVLDRLVKVSSAL